MSRSEIIKLLKQKNSKLNQSEITNVVDAFCNDIEKALKDGKKVELRGFGTFFVKKIKAKYSARNPKTGELIYVPEKNKVRFKASKNLKKIINEKI
ncbi:integration host factor subunit beta [Candidatus Pelagibacter bacterium]|nr:integration host factor subunit beta [Candidatus Pelagibacter bacterium]